MPATPELSVVIPVYNEEKNISESLRRIQAFMSLKGKPWEVIVSDDGSLDQTVEVVKKFSAVEVRVVSTPVNQGKGAAVRRGILAAHGNKILVTDADLSAPIKESDKLVQAIEDGAEVAIGSRAIREKGADVQQSLKRRLAGRVFNWLVRIIVVKGLKDTQCGFKCFTRDAAAKLFQAQKMDGFAFDVEILYLAQKNGFRIKEVPVMWKQGEDSHVRLFRDSFGMAFDLFKIKSLHRDKK